LTFLDLEQHVATLKSGMALTYVREGTGPNLIFIHGAMGDWRAFAPQWAAFADKFDCISYSRRYSFPNPNKMNTRDHNALVDAEDLEGLMDALEIEEAILVGSSYGGYTALATALRMPARVRAVVAVEAPMMRYVLQSDTPEVAEAFIETTAKPARQAFERGDNALGARLLTGGIVGQAPARVPAEVMERRMLNVHAARSLALSDDEFPWLEPAKMAALPMPLFLISGKNTAPIHAAIFQEVCKAMPQAKSLIVEGAGHSVAQQQPETFNAEVLSFLGENNLLPAQAVA
jgi:pimeloyl-ACP methyl ester carboxylesterase